MWKIIKKNIEKILLNKKKFSLWMKWEFKIEFSNDSFWPYDYKFEREDCYFVDWLEDRWTKIFPLKNKKFDNTEIFLETDDIIICIWERWSLMWWKKSFIDIINIKTEKKYRLFTNEINLIYNEKDKLIINAEVRWIFKTLVLDIDTLEKIDDKDESLNAFFKVVYNNKENLYYRLDFTPNNEQEKDEEKKYKSWYFSLLQLWKYSQPVKFDRENFKIELIKWFLDVWHESSLKD